MMKAHANLPKMAFRMMAALVEPRASTTTIQAVAAGPSNQRLRPASVTKVADISAPPRIASLTARTRSSSVYAIAVALVLSSCDYALTLSLAASKTSLVCAFNASTALPLTCRAWSTALAADDQSWLTTSRAAFLMVPPASIFECFAS